MKSAIRKMGNSHGVIIPKPVLEEIGAKANDPVDVRVKKGKIIISPVKSDARAGWAEASERLREAGDAGLVWPEFANRGDENLE